MKRIYRRKLLDRKELKRVVDNLRAEDNRIVFTNGCFDIIHAGHILYLREAKSVGDVLIVGINSDYSIRAIKPGRPIIPQEERIEVLSALDMIDYITLFDEETPYELISFIRPHILVKGGDWEIENIVGKEFVKEVRSLPYKEGVSTTKIIERILERFCKSS